MSTEPLSPWPDRSEYLNEQNGDRAGFNYARYKAALTRLRAAYDALDAIAECEYESVAKTVARETLAAIGEIP